jgi:hypothetical protein
MTEIILIRYKMPKLEKECIESIKKYTKEYKLTVFDNAPKNENLGKLWNRLIKKSNCENICLLNTDTLVEEGWLEKLEECLMPGVGAVGPTTNCCRTHQCDERGTGSCSLTETYPGEMLGGFCLLFPKKVWNDVGGFPEDFGFYGQETAWLAKVEKAGYRQVWRRDVFIYHYGSASAKEAEKRGELNEEAERKIGREKYKRFLEEL